MNFERTGFLKGFGKCVADRICPRICFCGESISKNAFRWFESVYRSEMTEMYQHNFKKLHSRKKRRNLSKSPLSRFFVPASKSDTHSGWDSWTRTIVLPIVCGKLRLTEQNIIRATLGVVRYAKYKRNKSTEVTLCAFVWLG